MTDREAEEVGCSPGSPPQHLTQGSQSPQRRKKGSPLGGPWLRGSMSQLGQVGAPGEAGICSPLMQGRALGSEGLGLDAREPGVAPEACPACWDRSRGPHGAEEADAVPAQLSKEKRFYHIVLN